MKLNPKAAEKAVEELAADLAKKGFSKQQIADGIAEFKRLLGFEVKPAKLPKPAASMPAQARGRSAPPASEPNPKLTREPAPSAKPESKSEPLPGRVRAPESQDKDEGDDEEANDKGVVEIKKAVKAVRAVLRDPDAADIAIDFGMGLLPVDLDSVYALLKGDASDADKIIGLIRKMRMFPSHPRKPQRLKVPTMYPSGRAEPSIIRRVNKAKGETIVIPQELFALVPLQSGGLRERGPGEPGAFTFDIVPINGKAMVLA